MAGQNYYLITSLPPLGELGSTPAIGLSGLLEHVVGHAAAQSLVEALLLSDDLLQRQGYLTGEAPQPQPTVLTAAQIRDEEPLPEYLIAHDAQRPPAIQADAVWAAYYHHVARLAARHRSAFLAAWCGYEVALRNALVVARARDLQLDAEGYLVAVEFAQDNLNFETLLSEWASASDPLAGLRVLDRARWSWLAENDAWFSFADDELAAYAVRLLLLHRWHRLDQASAPRQQQQETVGD